MSAEPVFGAVELERFLRAADRCLDVAHEITLIGGSAAAIAYGVAIGTSDVDLFESNLPSLQRAFQFARVETGLDIPVSEPSVADVPYNCQDCLQRVLPDLRLLAVWALERHDLALSKTIRGNENDFVALEELHRLNPLIEETLVTRYLSEMDHANVAPDRMRWNFLMLITRLYGEIAHDRVQQQIARHLRAKAGAQRRRGLKSE